MTDTNKRDLLADSLNKLKNTPKNIKCPGVVRKRQRQLRKLNEKLNNA